jgi:drug/metabolite transporter (DMT)-like permease
MFKRPGAAYFFVLFPGIVWGGSFSLLRYAVENGMHPLSLSLWQMVLVASLFFIVGAFGGHLRTIRIRHIKHYVIIALIGNTIPTVLYFYAVAHVPAGILAITISLVPMMTYALAWSLGLEAAVASRIAGIVLGFAAILLITLPDAGLPNPGMAAWVMLAVGAAFCYTVENIYVDSRIEKSINFVALLAMASLIAVIILLPLNLLLGTTTMPTWPPTRAEYSIAGLAVINVICYLMFMTLIRNTGSVFASQMGYVVTLSGVFWGMYLFHETHSHWVWMALVVMLVGMALVTPRKDSLVPMTDNSSI